MERVSLFIDFYNFISSSHEYLKQNCYIDFINMKEYFIDKDTQVYSKTYIYGGLNFNDMLKYLEKQPRIDVIRGEVGTDNKEKCTDINIATGLLTKAFYNSYDVALLFSGDRDYKKVVRELRRMGKIVGIVTPGGQPKKKAKDLANNVDFHIVLQEDFYKKYWNDPTGKPYESMINKPKVISETVTTETKKENITEEKENK